MVYTLTASALVALLGLTSASPVQNAAGSQLHKRQTAACAPVMVIFARGTTETAPLGSIVGPPLQSALESMAGAGNVKVQGVDYPANVAGFTAGGDAQGSATMAQMVKQAVANCPDSNVIMSGYSQGGQLVHNAAEQLDAATASKVSSAVIFGDPDNPAPVAGISTAQTKVFCAQGDLICDGKAIVRAPHLSYGGNAEAAAQFIMSAVTTNTAAGATNGTAAAGTASTNSTAAGAAGAGTASTSSNSTTAGATEAGTASTNSTAAGAATAGAGADAASSGDTATTSALAPATEAVASTANRRIGLGALFGS